MKIVRTLTPLRFSPLSQTYSVFFCEKNLEKFQRKFVSSIPTSTTKPTFNETKSNSSLKTIGDKLQPYLPIVAVLGATFGLYNALKGNMDALGKRLDDQNSTLNKRLDDQNAIINNRLEDKFLVIEEKIHDLRRDFKEVNKRR